MPAALVVNWDGGCTWSKAPQRGNLLFSHESWTPTATDTTVCLGRMESAISSSRPDICWGLTHRRTTFDLATAALLSVTTVMPSARRIRRA